MPHRRSAVTCPLWLLLGLAPAAHATIPRPGGGEVPDNLWPTLETISSVAAARYAALEEDPLPFPLGEVDGFADLHVHQFSHLGFDQRVVWGSAFQSSSAIDSCRDWGLFDLIPESKHGVFLNANVANAGLHLAGRDPIGYDLVDMFDHPFRTRGFDEGSDRAFEDWPVWYTWAHQQHAVDRLAQAHADGLNLIVMSAVSNRVLCLLNDSDTGPGYCGDNLNIEPQLIAAWQLSEDLDRVGDDERDRDAWYQPVVSAGDANHVMAEGRLAVVLTVEGDEIFDVPQRGGWVTDTNDDAELAEIVNYYGLLGVRVFHPIHEFDNLVGAAAHVADSVTAIHPLLDELPLSGGLLGALGDLVCDGGPVACMVDYLSGEFAVTTALSDGAQQMGPTEDGDPANLAGLTSYGGRLIDLLESENLVIDLAHMSRRMQRDVLDRLAPTEPAIVSHTRYQITRPVTASFDEFTTSDALAVELAARGGMVGVRTIDSRTNTFELDTDGDGDTEPLVENSCVGSTRSVAQMFLHGELLFGLHQGLGSDFNGATTQVRPRFYDPDDTRWNEADWACRGNTTEQEQQTDRTGTDYDLIGLGHIGLEGAMIADLRAVGFDTVSLQGSGQDFLDLWAAVGTYVPDFPPEERLPRFEPNPGFDKRFVQEALCSVMDCSTGSIRIPDFPDFDWIDILVDTNERGTGYDPFPTGELRDEAVIGALEGGIGFDLVWDDTRGWVNSFRELRTYRAFNDDLTLNLDEDPATADTTLLWPGLFNKDATLDFDLDVETYDQPLEAWGGGTNTDDTLDLDRDPRTLDTRLTRDILFGGR